MDDDRVDQLYGLPLEEFVAARDALAKELRQAGDRAAAAEVKKLAKPTVAAGAVNRLVRERPDEVRGLVEAGEALAGAQDQLLTAGAPPQVLREAVDAARRLVDALAAAAAPEGPTREKVRATLHAATVDPEVRAEVAAGRVTRERAAVGFGGLEALVAAGAGGATAKGEAAAPVPGKGGASARGKAARSSEAPRPRKGRASASGKAAGPSEVPTPGKGSDEKAAREGSKRARSSAKATGTGKPKPEPPREDGREVRRRRDALRRAKEAEAAAAEAVAGARHSLEQVEATLSARERELVEAERTLADARERRERAEAACE